MKKVTLIIVLIFGIYPCRFSQITKIDKNDLKIIKHFNAIKLTDTINFPLAKKIKTLTIDYLKQKYLNPDDYYILNDLQCDSFDSHFCYLELFEIKTLRIFYNNEVNHKIAPPGGYGAIKIEYNSNLTKIIRHYDSE